MDLEQAVIRTLFEQFRLFEWLINVQQSFPTKQINRKLFSAKDNPKKPSPAVFNPKRLGKCPVATLPNEKKKKTVVVWKGLVPK